MKIKNISKIMVLFLVIFSLFAFADSVNLQAGGSYYAILDTFFDSTNWGGVVITQSGADFDLRNSDTSFATLSLQTPIITSQSYPGDNLKDSGTYYAFMHSSTFNISQIRNATSGDVTEFGMFPPSLYPQFHTDWDAMSDNPDETYCGSGCVLTDVLIGGVNYTALEMTLGSGGLTTKQYLLAYDNGGNREPLHLVPNTDWTCYEGSTCQSQFILPISSTNYQAFIISQFRLLDMNILIDSVDILEFEETARPYYVTVELFDFYTSDPVADTPVFISELNGMNLFVPQDLSGFVSLAYTVGETDINGEESFLISPTNYPDIDSYEIRAGYIDGDTLVVIEDGLFVDETQSTTFDNKFLSPASLSDNAKVTVVSMKQLANFMRIWSSIEEQKNSFRVRYEINTDTFTQFREVSNNNFQSQAITLRSGALNELEVIVTQGGVTQSSYDFQVVESGGYLVMNPYTGSTPYNPKDRFHYARMPSDSQVYITPTDLGQLDSNVTIEIYDNSGTKVSELALPINVNLVEPSSEVTVNFDDDIIKTTINDMTIILNSIFEQIN